jgi:hypothetical protein
MPLTITFNDSHGAGQLAATACRTRANELRRRSRSRTFQGPAHKDRRANMRAQANILDLTAEAIAGEAFVNAELRIQERARVMGTVA